ncbi:MAG: N-6 DNA methylase [Acidobacteria bacterium]|nr:N-6 DNA methylase [Acidobacteriota bacterium]
MKEKSDLKNTLIALEKKATGLGFDHKLAMDLKSEEEAAAIVWGMQKGEETPRLFLLALVPGIWEKATPETVQQRMWDVTPPETPEDAFPKFGLVADGSGNERCFSLEYPPHEIDQLPSAQESMFYRRIKADPTYRWSMKMYDRLQKGFNTFHEQVYQTVKDRVNDKNDIIEEVAKFLFLESFRLHHERDTLDFEVDGRKYNLADVFTVAYVKKNGKQAVKLIQASFDHFKTHPDYVVTDDDGNPHPIFDEQTHLRLDQPRNHETLLDLIQNLGPVTDNRGREVKMEGTLADVAADALGRAFDVFLRANFDSKGGLGVYLTPAPVKHAMLEMAFHDIKQETPEMLTARQADGRPAFRFGDPCGGTFGFGVVALGYLERTLAELLGKETSADVRREKLFQDMCRYSFVGSDNSPRMVMLARVNMALMGAPKVLYLRTDSRITPQLKPNSFDLICTNPPFGTPKFKAGQEEARRRYEEDMEKILQIYRSDLNLIEGRKDQYTYAPTVSGLAMGGTPNNKGIWKPIGPMSIDPAIIFIDRCLQLLKPGGRLLIIVPDGVLCNSGDRYVREYIMGKKDEATGQFHGGKAIVKAVISLPQDAFKLSGTGAKTSVLYLQKRHSRKDDPNLFQDLPQIDVFMGVADSLGYEVKNNVEDYTKGLPNDLAAIVGAYVRGE